MEINIEKLIEACDKVAERCTTIGGKYHRSGVGCSSPWLFDYLMRVFTKTKSCVSVTISVHIGNPVNLDGEAEIWKDGTLRMRTTKKAE